MTFKGGGDLSNTYMNLNKDKRKLFIAFIASMLICASLLGIFVSRDVIKGEPIIQQEEERGSWFDTFNDTLGTYSMYHVILNETRDDVTLEGYWNNFDNEPVGIIPWWSYEYVTASCIRNIIEDPHEPGRCLYLAMNDYSSGYREHKLWIEFETYLEILDFHLTPWELKGTNRQAYFYIEFYNNTNDETHEVRYYWDDNRSGVPASSSTLTAIGLGWPLPTGGQDFGNIKFILHENISEDIDANTFVDLSSLLVNTTKVRYGFYQDAGPNWIQIDQVHIDDLGIHTPNNTGNFTSTEVSCPSGYGWDSIIVNKTEPGIGNFINITILDGITFEIIDNFKNLRDTVIDISSINSTIHPTIRVVAYFTGNGSATPILHDWMIKWNKIPAYPTGLKINNPFTGYSLILSWDSSSEPDLACYVIYYSTDNISFYWLANISAQTISFIHYGLSIGVTYYYKIATADEIPIQSPFSEVVEGIPDLDYDGDRIGNIADLDDDNDGIPDVSDPYPLNPLNDMGVTIKYINNTVSDIQNRVVDIQFDLDNMNISIEQLKVEIRNLNQTLLVKIDDLALQLSEVNNSLLSRVSNAEINILNYLMGMNTSLAEEIQFLLMNITNEVIEINASLSDRLTILLENMSYDHDALRQWLEIVLEVLDTNLSVANQTLQNQLNDLNTSVNNYYNGLTTDLGDVLSELNKHDLKTGENHSDIKDLLNNLMSGDILDYKLQDIKTMLINLAGNLSTHNQSIADDIMDVVNNIEVFESDMNRKMDDINNTLEELAKLDAIIEDLQDLDQSLQSAEEDLQSSIDVLPVEEVEEGIGIIEILLTIVIILLIVNIILTVIGKKGGKSKEPPVLPQGRIKPEELSPLPPTQESKVMLYQEIEKQKFPPPPPDLD